MPVKVSVVIACRNAEATLAVQLEALTRQDCPLPWNVVISDNGSTDRTVEIARSFADRLPGLSIVDSSDRLGAGPARNVGAHASTAELLVFCDADDEAAPGWLAAMVAALQQNPFVAGRFESRKLNAARTLRSRTLQQDDDLQESPFGPGLPHAGAGNLGVDRALFLSVGGFDPLIDCLEDTDLCWRVQLTGPRLVFQPDAVMHVRLRSSLSTMFGQGRAYGAASALLARRYPHPAVVDLTTATTSSTKPAAPRRFRAVRGLIDLTRTHRSVGAWLWTLGWHLGHRRPLPPLGLRPVSPSPSATGRAPLPLQSPARAADDQRTLTSGATS
jgi:glycosyltransferase involved in cell wall biosynthesis